MPPESGFTKSCWMDISRPEFPTLEQSINCEVAIIGAGIAGLTAAYLLAKEGKKVLIVEAGRVVCGETQRTTAHISDVLDESFHSMVQIHGVDNIRLIKDSLTASIKKIEQIIIDEKIDCDFAWVDAFLWLAEGTPSDYLKKEHEAARTVGHDVQTISSLDLITGSPPALRYSKQAQFHSVKYLCGLIESLKKMSVPIYADSRVAKVEAGKLTLENKCQITCKQVIVATNSPISDLTMQIKQTAYRTFSIGIKIEKDRVPSGLFWDTLDPYHYVRTHRLPEQPEFELLIVGGEDHPTGDKNDAEVRFRRLEDWARDMFKIEGEVLFKWSGQVYEPYDGLGYIGLDPELKNDVYIITGDSGMGITNGTVGAMLLKDLILGTKNPWEEIYSPSRVSLKAASDFLGDSARSVSRYANNVFPHVVQEEKIPDGEGAIIARGLKKLAAYRDEKTGKVDTVSPYCTHLGAMLSWNSCEKSWDCPVHGSRFAADGDLIYGPADGNLAADS